MSPPTSSSLTLKVVYPEYDDSVEEDEIFQSEDSQVFIFFTLITMNIVKMLMVVVVERINWVF